MPTKRHALTTLDEHIRQVGNKEEARKALEQALVLDPKFAGAADAQRGVAGLKE